MRKPSAGEGKLEVRKMFEPNRLQKDTLAWAYERLVPVLKRTAAPQAEAMRLRPEARRSSGGTRR